MFNKTENFNEFKHCFIIACKDQLVRIKANEHFSSMWPNVEVEYVELPDYGLPFDERDKYRTWEVYRIDNEKEALEFIHEHRVKEYVEDNLA